MILTLSREQLDAVLAVEEAAQPRPWSRAQLEVELCHPDALVRGFLVGEALVGFAAWRFAPGEVSLLDVGVLPQFRRGGVGRALVEDGLALARARDVTQAWLEVRASNVAAIALYEKLGFARVSVRRGYYRPIAEGAPHEDAVVMKLITAARSA